MQSGLGGLMRERFLGAFEGRLVGDKTAGAARRGVAWRGEGEARQGRAGQRSAWRY